MVFTFCEHIEQLTANTIDFFVRNLVKHPKSGHKGILNLKIKQLTNKGDKSVLSVSFNKSFLPFAQKRK